MGIVKYIFSTLFVLNALFSAGQPKRVFMTLPIVFKLS